MKKGAAVGSQICISVIKAGGGGREQVGLLLFSAHASNEAETLLSIPALCHSPLSTKNFPYE